MLPESFPYSCFQDVVRSPAVRERIRSVWGLPWEMHTNWKQSWEMKKTVARVWGASAGFVFPSPKHQADPQQAQEKAAWGTGVAQEQQGGGARSQPHEDQQLQQQLQKFSPFQLYQSPDSACCRKSDSLCLELCSTNKTNKTNPRQNMKQHLNTARS